MSPSGTGKLGGKWLWNRSPSPSFRTSCSRYSGSTEYKSLILWGHDLFSCTKSMQIFTSSFSKSTCYCRKSKFNCNLLSSEFRKRLNSSSHWSRRGFQREIKNRTRTSGIRGFPHLGKGKAEGGGGRQKGEGEGDLSMFISYPVLLVRWVDCTIL